MTDERRIAITGLGIVCAIGGTRHEFWANAIAGRHGFRRVDRFDTAGCRTDVAAAVAESSVRNDVPRALRRASRTDRFCMQAAREAVAQAGLGTAELEAFGVAIGTTTAGMLEAERWCFDGFAHGFDRQPMAALLRLPTSAPADAVAAMLGAGGPRLGNMTACASGALAIGHAADLIRAGEAPGVLAGGGDALCRMTYAGFSSLRLLDARPCRPFDATRQGLSLGEGAGVLVLERWDHALGRGARPLAEFLDYGASCDAEHMTAPHPDGRGAAAAMTEALARSGLRADRIGHVNAHGTGTSLNDVAEARAMRTVFGADGAARIPLTSSKSMVGHVLGGAGGIEAVALVLSLMHQLAPPTLGFESSGEPHAVLDVVTGAPRPLHCAHGMSNSFGFGGANCSLIFATAA